MAYDNSKHLLSQSFCHLGTWKWLGWAGLFGLVVISLPSLDGSWRILPKVARFHAQQVTWLCWGGHSSFSAGLCPDAYVLSSGHGDWLPPEGERSVRSGTKWKLWWLWHDLRSLVAINFAIFCLLEESHLPCPTLESEIPFSEKCQSLWTNFHTQHLVGFF